MGTDAGPEGGGRACGLSARLAYGTQGGGRSICSPSCCFSSRGVFICGDSTLKKKGGKEKNVVNHAPMYARRVVPSAFAF